MTQLNPIFKWASKDGSFKRQVSSFRCLITNNPDDVFPAQMNRYQLYVSLACPWAHRVLIVRSLKGLENVLPVFIVDYLLDDRGWHFSSPEETRGCVPDPNGNTLLSQLYFKADKEYTGRFTVPVLWDNLQGTIVNNESSEIIRMLNTVFDEWSSFPGLTFYPSQLSDTIDGVNEWVYDQINNGVYKTGFATTQEAYEVNVKRVFEGLDRVESILASSPFLIGDTFTEADIRLFTTMVRFDPVYHSHFKCVDKTVTHDYPNILDWLRRVYRMDGISKTVDMEHIKKHYFMSHIQINPSRIVPLWNGPSL